MDDFFGRFFGQFSEHFEDGFVDLFGTLFGTIFGMLLWTPIGTLSGHFFWTILGTIFEWFIGDICCCSVTNRYLPPFYHLSREFRKRTLEKLAQEVRICQMDMAMVSSLILRFQQRLLRTDLHFWGFKTKLIFDIENQSLVIFEVTVDQKA